MEVPESFAYPRLFYAHCNLTLKLVVEVLHALPGTSRFRSAAAVNEIHRLTLNPRRSHSPINYWITFEKLSVQPSLSLQD